MRASHWKATLVQTTHLVLTNELPISSTVCSIFSKLVHPKHAIRYERQHSSEAMLFYWNRPYKHASTVNSPKSAMNRKESVRFDYAFHSEWVSPEMQPSGMAVKICLSSSTSRVAHKSTLDDRAVYRCWSIREMKVETSLNLVAYQQTCKPRKAVQLWNSAVSDPPNDQCRATS